MDAQDESRTTFRMRRHRQTHELVLVRFVHGQVTGAVVVLEGIPPDCFIPGITNSSTALGLEALGDSYRDAEPCV